MDRCVCSSGAWMGQVIRMASRTLEDLAILSSSPLGGYMTLGRYCRSLIMPILLSVTGALFGRPDAVAAQSMASCIGSGCLAVGGGNFFVRPEVRWVPDGPSLGRMDRTVGFDTLFSAVDSAAIQYSRFEARDRVVDRLEVSGLILLAGAVLIQLTDSNGGAWVGISGAALHLTSRILDRGARESFHRAVEWYNLSAVADTMSAPQPAQPGNSTPSVRRTREEPQSCSFGVCSESCPG